MKTAGHTPMRIDVVNNQVVTGDFVKLSRDLPAGCARLIVADPPFNIGYRYDVYDDAKEPQEYLEWAERWLPAAIRLLAPGGAFWLAAGDECAAEYKVRLDSFGLQFRSWVIWHYTFGVHTEGKFSRCHSHLLYYIKPGAAHTWHPERIKIVSARQEMGDKRAAEGGKVPPDVWTISRVCGTFGERIKRPSGGTSHPCQQPEAMLERVIASCSEPGDLVLDPFAGSGTTAATAKRLRRDYWTCDLSPAYADVTRKRLAKVSVFADDDSDMNDLARELGIDGG